jgi:MFS transporter, DHA1 family, tetracycline resistance protein
MNKTITANMAKKDKKDKGFPPLAAIMTIFIDVLGLGILIPVIPALVGFGPARILGPSWTPAHGFILLGWILATYPIFQFFATPILGQLSDRYGRRPILALSLVGTTIGYAMFAYGVLTKNIPLLFASRAIDGFTGGNMSVAQAVIADTSTPETRTRNFGLIGACFGLGFVLGPYLGARLSVPNVSFYGLFMTPHWFNTATPFWFATGISALNVVLVLTKLKETLHVKSRAVFDWTKSVHNIVKAVTDKSLRSVIPSMFFFIAGFGFFRAFFQVFLSNRLKFTTGSIGDYFAFVGICISVAQAVITPMVAKRYKNYQILRFSYFGNGILLMAMAMISHRWELFAITPLFATFNGLSMANTTSLLSASASRELQGEILGIGASVQAFADSITSALAGYIAASVGVNTPVLVGGGLVIVAGLIYNFYYHPSKSVLSAESVMVPSL